MTLTGAGHLLYRYAVESQDKLDRIRAQVEEFDSLQRGHVKLATVEGLLASFVSDFVVDLAKDYPGISITVTTAGTSGVAEKVGRHEADLGLVFGRCATARPDRAGAHASVIVPDGRHPIIRWPAESTAR